MMLNVNSRPPLVLSDLTVVPLTWGLVGNKGYRAMLLACIGMMVKEMEITIYSLGFGISRE